MYISVELSFYPFVDAYKDPVRAVVQRLQSSGLEVETGRMSTQVFGEYDEVMRVISDTVRWSFETYGASVFTAKIVNGDRRPRQGSAD
ncbi:MAG: thiamine-binding protein [Ectothiorhodospiraceae bacterium]|nr:thiamine-binding protein [Ectothiorhodospiraceae bacterium]MCH8503211.1 thiamine-binding protein [Ectothiorhodospiraceae bacterium]